MTFASVVDRIAEASRKHGSDFALRTRGSSYTYDELVAAANGIQTRIAERAPAGTELVGIVTGDEFHTYAALLAIICSGRAYVPINRANPVDRNSAVIEQAGLELILSAADAAELDCLPPGKDVVQLCDVPGEPGELRTADIREDRLAYLLFTSGSTGTPKGVPIQHRQLGAFVQTIIDDCGYAFQPDDRFLQMFELTFDLSVMTVFTPWCVGGCCCVVPEEGISYLNILDVLEKDRVTVALMVPSALGYLQRFLEEVRLPDLRLSLFCGEALTHDLVSEWSKSVPNAIIENVYGPTEATIFCLRYPWHAEESAQQSVNGVVPIGSAMRGMKAFVVDTDGSLCQPGARGELCLSGVQVMEGYWKSPDRTNAAFLDITVDGVARRAYRTGDIAFLNEHDKLIFCGRLDAQVKIDGHRIELGEIEHFARQFAGHSMAAVIVVPDPVGQLSLALFVKNGEFERDDLSAFLAAKLPSYMRPRTIEILDDLPLNLNGKIDRKALAALAPQ